MKQLETSLNRNITAAYGSPAGDLFLTPFGRDCPTAENWLFAEISHPR